MESSFYSESLRHCLSQTVRAGELKFCQVSGVTRHILYKKKLQGTELVGGGSFINGATLSSYIQRREKGEFPLLDPALAGLKGMEKYQSINKSN